MFLCLFISLLMFLSTCLSLSVFLCPSSLSFWLSLYLCVSSSVSLSLCLSASVCVCLFPSLSLSLSVSFSVYLSLIPVHADTNSQWHYYFIFTINSSKLLHGSHTIMMKNKVSPQRNAHIIRKQNSDINTRQGLHYPLHPGFTQRPKHVLKALSCHLDQ